jgi:hypothetical protein
MLRSSPVLVRRLVSRNRPHAARLSTRAATTTPLSNGAMGVALAVCTHAPRALERAA